VQRPESLDTGGRQAPVPTGEHETALNEIHPYVNVLDVRKTV